MTYGNQMNRLQVDDVVYLMAAEIWVKIIRDHSGYYDFEYTGMSLDDGEIYYFDLEDTLQ